MNRIGKLIVLISASSLLVMNSVIDVNAVMLTDENGESCYTLEQRYDINNPDYQKRVDSLGKKIAYEAEFAAYLSDFEGRTVTHIYNANDNTKVVGINNRTYIVESIVPGNETARRFDQVDFYWGGSELDADAYGFYNYVEIFGKGKYTVGEINDYLKDSGFKAHIVNCQNDESPKYVVYYDDTDEENVVATFLSLHQKYGAKLLAFAPVSENKEIYNDILLGDANADDVLNVRDCALIASFIAKGEAETLPDTADYNKDGKKNVRDAAAISKDLAKSK